MRNSAAIKNDYTGWQEVFRFSFVQGVRSKAYYVSLIIFSVILLFLMPVISFFQHKDDNKEIGVTEISQLIIHDETGLPIDYKSFAMQERYEGMTILMESEISKEGEFSVDGALQAIEDHMKEKDERFLNDVILKIRFDESQAFILTFVKASSANFSADDYEAFTGDFRAFFVEAKRDAIEVTPEQGALIDLPIFTSVEFAKIDETTGEMEITPKDSIEAISMVEYDVLLGLIMGVMMIINLAGSQISSSIVTEKSTRVVEYLMINVRPMALIVGKILASLLMVIIQMGCMFVAYLLGNMVSMIIFPTNLETSSETAMQVMGTLSNMSTGSFLLSLYIILVGVLFFCILAGLAGASVSKLDELAKGMQVYTLTLLAGTYIGMGICIMQFSGKVSPLVLNLCSLIPISAPFVLPANMLLGKISIGIAIIGAVLLTIVTIGLFVFTSKVYESMIFYNGGLLKIKDILLIAKNRNVELKEVK